MKIPETMFEVGGNVGWFAKAASEYGVKEIDAVDLNPLSVEIANTKMGIANYAGVAMDFAEYPPHRQYDLVVALDYLEHTYTPWADLQKLTSMVTPGGVLLIKTFLDDKDTNREMLAPPTHAIHWTTPVLRGAIERTGLVIRHWADGYKGFMPEIIAQKPQ